MWDFLKNLKSFLSLDYRSLLIVACVCWTIFFIPSSIWQEVGWLTLRLQARPWVLLIAIIASVWFVFGGIYDLIKTNLNKVNDWIVARKTTQMREKMLLSTSRVEKEVLVKYVAEDTTTLAFEMRDGIVNGLIANGILFRASTSTNPMSYDFDTNIHPWAWEYFKNHPEVLKDVVPNKIGRHQIRFS